MDDLAAQFTAITGAPTRKAESYLKVSDGDLTQAIQLFFDTGGADMEPSSQHTVQARAQVPVMAPGTISDVPIQIDDDDDDLREVLRASDPDYDFNDPVSVIGGSGPVGNPAYDEDEAMARRLQEEFYGIGGSGPGFAEDDGVRAPIARVRETLLGDDESGYPSVGVSVRRPRGSASGSRSVFNQRSSSVWDNTPSDQHQLLAESTGGASETSAKSGKLAEMYRPPFEIMANLSLEDARAEAKEVEKWILVNLQDNSIFACQILNRDIWKAPEVMATVKENFIFLQMDRAGRDGRDYIRLYIPAAQDPAAVLASGTSNQELFPHIAIIDPRTGEQVKVLNEVPKKPLDFVMMLHEFLERYSLKVDAKNPVQRRGRQKANVQHMSEEEQMQMAMQNSLRNGGSGGEASSDPDELTKLGTAPSFEGGDLMEFEDAKERLTPEAPEEDEGDRVFWKIRSDRHHAEPPTGPEVTRIQFKMSDGSRVVRRFLLKDRVERLFEYVKADLLPEQQEKRRSPEGEGESIVGKEFELVSLGAKLIDYLDKTVSEAGLKMGTIMVEILE